MTKKRGESAVGVFLRSFSGALLEKLQGSIETTLNVLQEKILDTQKKVMRGIYATFFTILGLVFVLVGVVFLISERLMLPMSISFLLVGLIVLVLVLFYRTSE